MSVFEMPPSLSSTVPVRVQMKSAQGEMGQTGKYGTRGSHNWALNAGDPTERRMQTPTALKPRESHLRANLALKESVGNRS